MSAQALLPAMVLCPMDAPTLRSSFLSVAPFKNPSNILGEKSPILLEIPRSSTHSFQVPKCHPILLAERTAPPTGPRVSDHLADPSAWYHLCCWAAVVSQTSINSSFVNLALADPWVARQTSLCHLIMGAVAAFQVAPPFKRRVAAIERPAGDGTEAAAATLSMSFSSTSDTPLMSAP